MALTRKDILTANDLPRVKVSVPEWGGDVWVRTLSAHEYDGYQSSIVETRGKKQIFHTNDFRAQLCALTICDDAGDLLFTKADVLALSGKSSAALQRIYDIAVKLSGIGDAEIEELTGEMAENPTGDLPTD